MKEKAKDFLIELWQWCQERNIIYKLFNFILALFILWLVFKIINKVTRKIEKNLEHKKIDRTITRFVIKSIAAILKVISVITFIGYVGIETSSIAAAITSLGVAVGLALQGSLSNGAAGLVILLTRPYKLGDFIECSEGSGTVEDIKLFHTTLTKTDNVVIIIPNSQMISSAVKNYSINSTRRLEETFSISYENDFNKAKDIILKCIEETGYALDNPAKPFVSVSAHSASSIDIVTRVWVNAENYWDLHFYLLERVKTEFDKHKISIPYNQMDVHIIK